MLWINSQKINNKKFANFGSLRQIQMLKSVSSFLHKFCMNWKRTDLKKQNKLKQLPQSSDNKKSTKYLPFLALRQIQLPYTKIYWVLHGITFEKNKTKRLSKSSAQTVAKKNTTICEKMKNVEVYLVKPIADLFQIQYSTVVWKNWKSAFFPWFDGTWKNFYTQCLFSKMLLDFSKWKYVKVLWIATFIIGVLGFEEEMSL